jgi:hypothetical protein
MAIAVEHKALRMLGKPVLIAWIIVDKCFDRGQGNRGRRKHLLWYSLW